MRRCQGRIWSSLRTPFSAHSIGRRWLNRHRGKGQQKVTVEHVHVHSGGQAIVGPVAPGRRGIKNTKGELDAVRGITYEPSTPMRSPDPEREPVPIACGARKTAL